MRDFNIRVGKVMISFALVIIFLGFSFTVNDGSKNINTSTKDFDDFNITITTIDGEKPVVDKDNNSATGNTDGGISSGSIDSSSKPNNSSGNSNGNTNSGSTNNRKPGSVTAESSSGYTTQAMVNNNKKLEIQNKYGIYVKYGSEVEGYKVGGYGIESLYDENRIYNSLVDLDNTLSKYPSNMFIEEANAGLPLTVYLIKRYTAANITGVTEKTSTGVVISIATDFPFEDSFYHESYHYMEHYIAAKGGSYSNWNNYNPSGFNYGNYDTSYVYTTTFSPNAYFVNGYSQSYDYEDRASTFEYMMANNKISPLNQGNPVWFKAKVMCEVIDYYFNTVSPNETEYWERFVY